MTLNEAIYKVISTQFKKDMGDALKIVENAGYKVTKWDGRFYVKNETTRRELCLREGYKGYKVCGNGYDKCRFGWNDVCPMDLVGYLNKEINRNWYELEFARNDWMSPTWRKYTMLKDAKSNIKYNETAIEKLRKEIAEKQNILERCIADAVRREQKLTEVRKQLGLIK